MGVTVHQHMNYERNERIRRAAILVASIDEALAEQMLDSLPASEATKILATCRSAMAPHATLLVVEHLVCPPKTRCAGKVADVQMMVRTGGRNRSIAELGHLLTAAGFQNPVAQPTDGGPDLVVAKPMA